MKHQIEKQEIKNKKIFVIILLLMFFCFVQNARAEVIFEDNFDSQADWWPNNLVVSNNPPPINWNYYRVDEYWSPYALNTDHYGMATPNSQPALQIKGGDPYVTSGKAFIVSNEAADNSPNGGGSGWSSDAILMKILDRDYSEIFVQFKMKVQPDFKRYWPKDGSAAFKMFRINHWSRTGSPFTNGGGGNVGPSAIYDPGQNAYGSGLYSDSIRCGPPDDYNSYFCVGQNFITKYKLPGNWPTYETYIDNSAQAIWDGDWHIYAYHLKINSAGGVADGLYEAWLDNAKIVSLSNIAWVKTGVDVNTMGWNSVGLGGNNYNDWASTWRQNNYNTWPQGSVVIYNGYYYTALKDTYDLVINPNLGPKPFQYPDYWEKGSLIYPIPEQWYAIDDVVVSTTSIPNDYVIGEIQTPTSFNTSNFITLIQNYLKKESNNPSDLNSDGIINSRDLGIMMSKWN